VTLIATGTSKAAPEGAALQRRFLTAEKRQGGSGFLSAAPKGAAFSNSRCPEMNVSARKMSRRGLMAVTLIATGTSKAAPEGAALQRRRTPKGAAFSIGTTRSMTQPFRNHLLRIATSLSSRAENGVQRA
jgi:hypothetical protein